MTNVGEVDGRHATLSGELVEEGKGDRIDRVILAVVSQRLLTVCAILSPVPVRFCQLIPNVWALMCGTRTQRAEERIMDVSNTTSGGRGSKRTLLFLVMSNAMTRGSDPRARRHARARKERIVKARRGYLKRTAQRKEGGGKRREGINGTWSLKA